MTLVCLMSAVRKAKLLWENCSFQEMERMLLDPEYPVILSRERLHQMMRLYNDFQAKFYLQCLRIDWLAPTWDRALLKLEAQYGIQYEEGLSRKVQSTFDYFYYLDEEISHFNDFYARKIYERIMEELVKAAPEESTERLLFRTVDSLLPFKLALRYNQNINVKDELGHSLLHLTKSVEVIQFLIESGVDLNAVNNEGMTALMVHARVNRIYLVKLLLVKGANFAFINSKGLSVFSVCAQKEKFLDYCQLTEEMFCSELKRPAKLTRQLLEQIFTAYPHFKTLFDSKKHLTALKDWHKSEYSRELSDEEYMELLRSLASKRSGDDLKEILQIRPERVRAHANELLHLSAQSANYEFMNLLLSEYHADANSCLDGRTAIFKVKLAHWNEDVIDLLLTAGADPFLEVEGKKFFEREGFLPQNIPSKWLFTLHKNGFNVSDCLSESRNTSAQIRLEMASVKCWIPAGKVTSRFFEATNWFSPIDAEGNTILHYACAQNQIFLSRMIKLESLRKANNEAGQTAFDVLIENDVNFNFGLKLKRPKDLETYLKAFLALHGDVILKRVGGRILLNALSFENRRGFALARYLVQEKDVALTRYMGNAFLIDLILEHLSVRILRFLLSVDYRFGDDEFLRIVEDGRVDCMKVLMSQCSDPAPFIELLARRNCFALNDATKYFFEHESVLGPIIRKGQNKTCSLLDLNFFSLSKSVDLADYFCSIGVEARNLIGTGRAAVMNETSYFSSQWSWQYLSNAGWTVSEFKSVSLKGHRTVFDFYVQNSEAFLLKYGEVPETDDRTSNATRPKSKSSCTIC